MAPLIEVSEDTLRGLKQLGVSYAIREVQSDNNNFIPVPSMNIYVSKEKTHLNKNWFEAQEELQKQEQRMLTLPEFVELLKYTPDNFEKIYKEITEARNPWRAEWLDAYFEQRKDGMYVLTRNKTRTEKLDKDTLMEDKRISLESWLDNPTKQGLPTQKTKKGDLYYWHPRNDSVAGFDAYFNRASLDCYGDSNIWNSNLGVRAVRHE